MSKREFILQGITKHTHLAALQELFEIPDITRVLLSVAFVNESGVRLISEQLKNNSSHVIAFAGIRNDITSLQGLRCLKEISNKVYTVDTGSRRLLFHPKVYLVRGHQQARLVLGSANLTLGGLNNNVESGLLLHFDLTKKTDKALVDNIDNLLCLLPTDYPNHVQEIDNPGLLDDLLSAGRIVDEMAALPPRPSTSSSKTSVDKVPPIKLKVSPLRTSLVAAKAAPKQPATPQDDSHPSLGVELELVWESKPLTRRDLSIPKTEGTHATGSVNLDKGLLPNDIDHRHYFRDIVFPHLAWNSRSRTVDEAFAKFHLILKGVSYGEFDLGIHHSTSTTSVAYRQRNAMTRLSWGPMRQFISSDDYIGRTLSLFRDKIDPQKFVLEID